jgi:Flp pilus assembly protein CpaB
MQPPRRPPRRPSLLGPTHPLAAALRSLRRAVVLRRRLLAAVLAAGAVALGLDVVAPEPPATVPVVVAGRDLRGGAPLAADDLAVRRLPPAAVPRGSVQSPRDVLGRVLAAPMRTGEPLTDLATVGRDLLRGYGPGVLAAPVRIADAGAVALVRVGDHVDVLAPDPRGSQVTSVAVSAAPVLAVPEVEGDTGVATGGGLLVLAVSAEEAGRLAERAALGPLSIALRE